MNNIEKFIKEAYSRLKIEKFFNKSSKVPSEEDMARYCEGLMSEKEKKAFLADAILNNRDEEALKNSFLLASGTGGSN